MTTTSSIGTNGFGRIRRAFVRRCLDPTTERLPAGPFDTALTLAARVGRNPVVVVRTKAT